MILFEACVCPFAPLEELDARSVDILRRNPLKIWG